MWFSSANMKFDSSKVIRCRRLDNLRRSSSLRELFFLRLILSLAVESRLEDAPRAPAWSEKWTDFEGLLLDYLVLTLRCLFGELEVVLETFSTVTFGRGSGFYV